MNEGSTAGGHDGQSADQSTSTAEWDDVLVDLYETQYRPMVGLARRLLDTDSFAEEAVQDAFVKYHTAKHKPAPGKELPYLKSIVLNTARSMMRRRRTAQAWHPEFPNSEPSTESDWLRRRDAESVRDALRRLPDRQRQVLTCRHLVGLSERETADVLSISIGSVKTHSSRARHSMRELIGSSDAA